MNGGIQLRRDYLKSLLFSGVSLVLQLAQCINSVEINDGTASIKPVKPVILFRLRLDTFTLNRTTLSSTSYVGINS